MKTVQNLEWKEVDFRQNTPNQWYFQPVMKYNAQKIVQVKRTLCTGKAFDLGFCCKPTTRFQHGKNNSNEKLFVKVL